MKNFKFFILIFLCLSIFSSCASATNSVDTLVNEQMEKILEGEDSAIESLAMAGKSRGDLINYTNLVKEIAKNVKYEILNSESKDGNVLVTMKVNSFEPKELVIKYYDLFIQEVIDSELRGESPDKSAIRIKSMESVLEYLKSTKLDPISYDITLIYEKENNKKWTINNPEELSNAITGRLFEKMYTFNNEEAPTIFISKKLDSLKSINEEQANFLLSGSGRVDIAREFLVKFCNSIEYKIISSEKKSNETEYKVSIETIDLPVALDGLASKFVEYIKTGVESKSTPSADEAMAKMYELLREEDFSTYTENRKSTEYKIIISDSLMFVNQEDFLKALISDYETSMHELQKIMATKINE